MSASREKKQRQEAVSGGPSEKQRKELKEAAKARNKKILYGAVGVVAAVLIIALLVWNSNFFQKRAVAATVSELAAAQQAPGGDDAAQPTEEPARDVLSTTEYNAAQVGFYYYTQANIYKQYGVDLDVVADQATGQTYREQLKEAALQNLLRDAVLCGEAEKAGFTLSADGQAEIDDFFSSLKLEALKVNYSESSYIHALYGPYMDQDTLRQCLTASTLADEYQQFVTDSFEITQERVDTYYKEHADDLDTFQFSALFISGAAEGAVDADGNAVDPTEEEKAAAMDAAKAEADKVVSQLKTGAQFDALALGYTTASDKNTYSSGDSTTGSLISSTYKTWMTDPARRAGDVTALESEGSGWYVLQFLGRELDQSPTADVRHILIRAEAADGAGAPTQEALDAAKAEAQRILDEFNAGDKSAESFGALAEQYSSDNGSNTNGGLYEKVADGQMFEGFNDWILDAARQSGDVTLIENPQSGQQGWHVVYFQGWNEPAWKNTVDSALRGSDYSVWYAAAEANYQVSPVEKGMALVD